MNYFAHDQRRTLLELYDRPEEWWTYLYLLSDAVREESEVAADGLLWMWGVKQRPRVEHERQDETRCRWWFDEEDVKARVKRRGTWCFFGACQNYLPVQLTNRPQEAGWGWYAECPVELIEGFLTRWCRLDPLTRSELLTLVPDAILQQ